MVICAVNVNSMDRPSPHAKSAEETLASVKIKADIKVIGRKNREAAINEIKKSEIGLLINSNANEHSTKYTSPLKYFEYLAAELKILTVDFNSHRKLPFADNIVFFKDKDFKSFKLALEKVLGKL